MAKKIIDFNKGYKKVAIVYLAIFLAGIIVTFLFGVDLDINFKGGTRITYSYTGEVKEADIEAALKGVIKEKYTIDKSVSIAGDSKTVSLSLIGNKSIGAKTQEKITSALTKALKDNEIKLYDSNSVSPNIAGSFFLKSIVAVVIAAAFVVLYVGIRFRKIGGVTAGLASLIALVIDILVTFFVCVFFRLQIDLNYIAVVLTILGYSLNDTIVTFDRIREDKKLYPNDDLTTLVNRSINSTMVRNIMTSVTTFVAVMTIVGVSEIFGLSTLRTFCIPMAFGIVSGAVSSLCLAGPIWVVWQNNKAKKAAKK